MERKNKPKLQRKKTGPKPSYLNHPLSKVEMLAKLGASNGQIAQFYEVDETTIDYWIKNYKDFRDARKRGGIEADLKVAHSLYQRAIGFEYEETKAVRSASGDFITEVTKKFQIPDVKAIIHWLRIRQRDVWSVVPEMQMNHHHSGKIEHLHNALQNIPVHELSDASRDVLFEITSKQLNNGERDN